MSLMNALLSNPLLTVSTSPVVSGGVDFRGNVGSRINRDHYIYLSLQTNTASPSLQ